MLTRLKKKSEEVKRLIVKKNSEAEKFKMKNWGESILEVRVRYGKMSKYNWRKYVPIC